MWQALTVPDTLVTQAMTDFEGVWGPVVESPPISATNARRYVGAWAKMLRVAMAPSVEPI